MELWDLYDLDRKLTGETMIRGERQPQDRYRIIVHICLFNSLGQMLIQKRQPFKSGFSGMWDITVGGSAVAGDDSRSAAMRELKEELGIDVDLQGKRPALTVNFKSGFDDMYVVSKDVDIASLKLQYEEVEKVKWADKEEIFSLIDEGIFIPYHKSLIDLLFYMRDHEGAHTAADKTAK
ncbi:MAG: NUDIX domain-containing protein [Erysipelotrichaceae bacterium]|nr:NUDIX domain-containing protein [Erysipelotrichaceae bacterium]